jgi:hypothetical protein
MKRLVTFKFNPDGRWAALSGVLLGIAVFAQAFDNLLVKGLQGISFFQLLVCMILPMLLEAVWCVCLRVLKLNKAEVYGVLGAVFALTLLLQAFFYHSVLLTVIFILLYLAGGAAMVLITWGFLAHRALGALVFFVIAALRVLFILLHRLVGGQDWLGLLYDLPSVCILLEMMLFFLELKMEKTE